VDQCPKKQEDDTSHISYVSVVGGLLYVMVYTIPHISHAVGVLGKYMPKPGKEHWTTVKKVFMYLCGTTNYGLRSQGRPILEKVLEIH
jgi:hypothetical protein